MTAKKPDEIDVATGHRIRLARLSKGMSQSTLARSLGVTFQQVQKYEKGMNRVGAGRLHRIAYALGIPVEQLIAAGGYANDMSANPITKVMATSRGMRLCQAYAEMPVTTQAYFADLFVDIAIQLRIHPEERITKEKGNEKAA